MDQARAQLETSLRTPELCNEDYVRRLVEAAFQDAPAETTLSASMPGDRKGVATMAGESRCEEVLTFLKLLRGAGGESVVGAGTEVGGLGAKRHWKLKMDNGAMRVLYRRGPEGTPFHTMCLEGLIDGPLTTALCVLWEVNSAKNLYPAQYTEAKWIEQPRPGQGVLVVRLKTPWPFEPRETLLEVYAVPCFEKGIVIVLLKTPPPGPSPFSKDGPPIPPVEKGVTRMDVRGGYVFQQISPSQCYFRTIFHMDMKLALVPAWIINLLSREFGSHAIQVLDKMVKDVDSQKGTKSVKFFTHLLETDRFLQQVREGLGKYTPPDFEVGKPANSTSFDVSGGAEVNRTS